MDFLETPRDVKITRSIGAAPTWRMIMRGTNAYGDKTDEPIDATAQDIVAYLLTGLLDFKSVPTDAIAGVLEELVFQVKEAQQKLSVAVNARNSALDSYRLL